MSHNIHAVTDIDTQISQLAQIMDEFGLEEASMSDEDWSVSFSRTAPNHVAAMPTHILDSGQSEPKKPGRRNQRTNAQPAQQSGTPIASPMMGIFYNAPSPGSPPFVKEGDTVSAGQVIGLIEAMKVFNEITCSSSGTVTKIVAENGQLVQPGEALLYIG